MGGRSGAIEAQLFDLQWLMELCRDGTVIASKQSGKAT